MIALVSAGCRTLSSPSERFAQKMERAGITNAHVWPAFGEIVGGFEHSNIADLTYLADMPVTVLHLTGSSVTDLSPLGRKNITRLYFSPQNITNGMEAVRNNYSLQIINSMPAATFWKRYDGQNGDWTGITDDAWLRDELTYHLFVEASGALSVVWQERQPITLSELEGGITNRLRKFRRHGPVVIESSHDTEFSKVWAPVALYRMHGQWRFDLLFPDSFHRMRFAAPIREGDTTRKGAVRISGYQNGKPLDSIFEIRLSQDEIRVRDHLVSSSRLEQELMAFIRANDKRAPVVLVPSDKTPWTHVISLFNLFRTHGLTNLCIMEEY